ncbi:MAG: flagellar basal-body MS-ring/collar protein FliF [Alkaliphilus sp.]
MVDAIDTIKNQLNDYSQSLDKKKKIQILVISILILLVLTVAIFYTTRVEYVVLYNNLSPREAGEVMRVLQDNNLNARFGDASGIVKVAKKDEMQAQIIVATEGLPAARFTFDNAFAGNTFMMTSEERAQRFVVAQQNSLATTIEEISGIRKTVVNLAVPDTSAFVLNDEVREAKASVFLYFELGTVLDDKSINGIAVLVANAVQGLKPENVTIHGSDGRVLNNNRGDGVSFTQNDQMSLQKTVEKELDESLTEFLSTVFGFGNVVVMSNVRLDFDSEITEITEFSPPIEGETGGIVRSMQEFQKSVVDDGLGGVPGTDSNIDGATQYVEGEQDATKYSEASKTINYEINELRRKIIGSQGQVNDISVAVYINEDAVVDGEFTAEEKRDLTSIISAAAGLDTKVVQIGVRQFDTTMATQFAGLIDDRATTQGIPFWAIIIIGVIVLVFAFLIVMKTRKKPEKSLAPVATTVEEYDELDLDLSGSRSKKQIEKMINKQPEMAAQLLKNWLSEE